MLPKLTNRTFEDMQRSGPASLGLGSLLLRLKIYVARAQDLWCLGSVFLKLKISVG